MTGTRLTVTFYCEGNMIITYLVVTREREAKMTAANLLTAMLRELKATGEKVINIFGNIISRNEVDWHILGHCDVLGPKRDLWVKMSGIMDCHTIPRPLQSTTKVTGKESDW